MHSVPFYFQFWFLTSLLGMQPKSRLKLTLPAQSEIVKWMCLCLLDGSTKENSMMVSQLSCLPILEMSLKACTKHSCFPMGGMSSSSSLDKLHPLQWTIGLLPSRKGLNFVKDCSRVAISRAMPFINLQLVQPRTLCSGSPDTWLSPIPYTPRQQRMGK